MGKAAPHHNARPCITLDAAGIRLHGAVIFQHTRWEILADQHWAVVGPNGSGKSTLAKAVCGKLPISGGRIVYHFAQGATSPQDRIAYVSFDTQKAIVGGQDPFHQARWNSNRSDESLSVSAYLTERRIRHLNPFQLADDRVAPATFRSLRDAVIQRLGIEDLLDRRIAQLSNGERRKLFIAQALLKRPRVLILDNPFTGLDEQFRARLRDILARLMQEDEMRVILVTTDRGEIPPGITHVLLVADGAVVARGPAEVILGSGSPRPSASPRRPSIHNLEPDVEAAASRRVPLVDMKDVSIAYNGASILERVNWSVRRGERWALLGPNGAGKTTLLSLILGDNPQAYANEIALFGRRRGSGESIWEIKRRIGWVAPELHLYYPNTISCFGVVCSGFFNSVGLYRRCSSQQREAALVWMHHVHMAAFADTPFNRISEGEQRLVLIARALVKRPELLVLDEPCQGLDHENRDRVLDVIDSIEAQRDTSMIYVTHSADELPRAITHVIELHGGHVVGQGKIRRQT